jgi:hypothetical protein
VIIIKGLASGRETMLSFDPSEKEENLLKWLRKKGITIASSCDGDGVCRKCVIQNGWLSCEFTLESFLVKVPSGIVEVSYL